MAVDYTYGMTPHVFSCEPGWEVAALDELTRVFADARHEQLAPGWIRSLLPSNVDDPLITPSLAFTRQVLPAAEAIHAESISAWVRQIGPRLLDAMRDHAAPWRLHVFNVPAPGTSAGARRCQLIADDLRAMLRKKQRRLLPMLIDEPQAGWSADEALVQVGLASPTFGWFSHASAEVRRQWRRCLSRFPGGCVEVPNDPTAPSRAFAKLREAELHWGREIAADQTCVDLGSSPGSWAWLALGRGARVIAVDRSPLRDDLMVHPRLTFVRGDAFAFEPSEPVDWLLSDIVAFPQRIAELLHVWISRRWCRRFLVTIKFRGADEYPRLEEFKRLLADSGAEFIVRRLGHNKNEATAVGELP